jgi:hypothetical protein
MTGDAFRWTCHGRDGDHDGDRHHGHDGDRHRHR